MASRTLTAALVLLAAAAPASASDPQSAGTLDPLAAADALLEDPLACEADGCLSQAQAQACDVVQVSRPDPQNLGDTLAADQSGCVRAFVYEQVGMPPIIRIGALGALTAHDTILLVR